ncbi:hypothetical protein [Paenibacillus chibensis]|uniref:hypothetical protein n=1 Tax=Paenibacillus chibensis TaxID=59846 RepID=UPI000FD70B0D|nr:hypothetical protein [Paenibacillus chibensis]MEC0368607.1 hypothetical protein [Paenibacillus chibensis]
MKRESDTEIERAGEKRLIILSLQPQPYGLIMQGIKKHEFRRKFLDTSVNAFIYVSSPVKAIKAYIEFDAPIVDEVDPIGRIAEQEGSGTLSGITAYMKGLKTGYAIPIRSFREIEPLTLEELTNTYHFTAPQSYIFADSRPELKEELLRRLHIDGEVSDDRRIYSTHSRSISGITHR